MEYPSYAPVSEHDVDALHQTDSEHNVELLAKLREQYSRSQLAQQFLDRFDRTKEAYEWYIDLTRAIAVGDTAKEKKAVEKLREIQPQLSAFNIAGRYFRRLSLRI
jgi:hypothetical protein